MSKSAARESSDKQRSRQAHVLLTKYEKLYLQTHHHRKVFNRYSAKWGMLDVVDSVGYERADELLEFYFKTTSDHSIEQFYRTYDKLDENERSLSADRIRRQKIRQQTAERIRENQQLTPKQQ